ncbi:hypothetical protein AN1V17_42130 [Vallitalea sediminicola]
MGVLEYIGLTLLLPSLSSILISNKLLDIKDKRKLNEIRKKIINFNESFVDTELDCGSFKKYFDSTNAVDKISEYIFASGELISEPEFIYQIADESHQFINKHKKDNGQSLIRKKIVFNYFDCLIKMLKRIRDSLLDINEKALASKINNDLGEMNKNIKDDLDEIKEYMRDKSKDLNTEESYLKDVKLINQSHKYYNTFPKPINRFKFNSESVSFFGREKEKECLINFCLKENKFCWWMICGAGGQGKTRLTWEFEKLIENQQIKQMSKWDIYRYLPNDNYIFNNDTLIILDYAKTNVVDIANWIEYIAYIDVGYNIRLLLIERDDQWIDEILIDHMKSYDLLYETCFSEEFLMLKSLNEAELINIMIDYAKHQNKGMTNDEANKLLKILIKVDKNLMRPLYALFISDAYIHGEKPSKWSKKDALDFVYNKEIHRLKKSIIDLSNNKTNTILTRNCLKLILIATIMRGIHVSELQVLYPKIYNIIDEQAKLLKCSFSDLLTQLDIMNEETIIPLEPDIIGEYFIVKELANNKKDKDIESMLSLTWKHYNNTYEVIRRLFEDFEDLLIEYNLNRYFQFIVIPDTETEIEPEAFWGCAYVCKLKIPKSVNKIGRDAFFACEKLEEIIVDENNPFYSSKEGVLFDKSMKQLLFYPTSKKNNIYMIPDTVKLIKSKAFYNCKNLQQIEMKEGVRHIESLAFAECCNISKIKLPDSLLSIGCAAFNGCEKIKQMKISLQTKEISNDSFQRCLALEHIEVDKKNDYYSTDNGVLYNKKMGSLIIYPLGKKDIEYTIPCGVKYLQEMSFSNNKFIKKINLPNSIIGIGKGAFFNCVKLQIVLLPDSIRELNHMIFANCQSLWYIKLPNHIISIPWKTFINCYSLKEIVIPNSVKVICSGAFANCKNLNTIYLSNCLNNIETYAFEACESLESIEIPNGVLNIKESTFINCIKLKNIKLTNSKTEIEKNACTNCYPVIHIRDDRILNDSKSSSFFYTCVKDLYIVTFVLLDNNKMVGKRNIIAGEKINKPLIKEDTFTIEFYKDKDCLELWDFNNDMMPTKNITLYIKKNLKKFNK